MRWHIDGSSRPRPESFGTIYCDGAAAAGVVRPGIDLELSHWVPNVTPERYRADTSTEICLNFSAAPAGGRFDLAVNNHTDVDGVLALYSVVEDRTALANAGTLVGAAVIGDFWGWAPVRSQALFQGLALVIAEGEAAGADAADVYERCFAAIPGLLGDDAAARPEIARGLRAVARAESLLDGGDVSATVHDAGFAAFVVPRRVAAGREAEFLRVPEFNAPFGDDLGLPPQVRSRDHGERCHLVSVEGPQGWWHELWYPGYAWAHITARRKPVGLVLGRDGEMGFRAPGVAAAFAALGNEERRAGRWHVASAMSLFGRENPRPFPVVASFVGDDGAPAQSSVPPDVVASVLAPVME
jgi:hypothetical protein